MNIHPNTEDAYLLLHQGILSLARAERQGIRIDMDYVNRKKQQIANKIEHLEDEFRETQFFKDWQKSTKTKVNINSGDQLGKFLYGVKGITVGKATTSGKGSTDEEALKQLNIPELDYLIRISKQKKLGDYLEGFAREQVDGVIHPFFNLHLVTTYRSSSSEPNFQNIPKRDEEAMKTCRKALFARPGHQLVEFDFSGAEVRVSCCYNKDENLLKYIKDPTTDMHGDLATQLFMVEDFNKKIPEHYTLRQAAKNGFVFPEFYGSYWKNCASNLVCDWGRLSPTDKWKRGQGIPMPNGKFLSDHLISKGITELGSVNGGGKSGQYVTGFMRHVKTIEDDFWKNRFPQYAQWKEDWYAEYQRKGYVDMHTGFRCAGIMRKTDVTNYPVQGAAFHCLLWSLIQLDRWLREKNMDSRIIGQIHDSIVVDMNPDELEEVSAQVQKIITKDLPEHWKWINVPIEMDMEKYAINGSWADKIK